MRDKKTESFNISNLKHFFEAGKINIPQYQREKVWSKYQKQLLIDSVLRSMDIPKLYFSKKFKSDNISLKQYDVVDGQQRIGTVQEYLNNEFALNPEFDPINGKEVANKKFDELDDETQLNFLNVNLDVVVLTHWSENDEKEMFSRLQEGTPLNAAEKRRSYPGEVPLKIQELRTHDIFSNSNIFGFKDKRFAYEDGCSKIFHQFYKQAISSIRPDDIKKSYKENQNPSTELDRIMSDIKRSMDLTFSALKDREIKLKKYTLIRIPFLMNHIRNLYNINDDAVKQIGIAYQKFEDERALDKEKDEDKQNPIFIDFINAARSDSVGNQTLIHEILLRYILADIPDLALKGRRSFTDNQRFILFRRSNGKCQANIKASWYNSEKCKGTISMDGDNRFEADHITPYSQGGKTSISNGQALCMPCNRRKSDS